MAKRKKLAYTWDIVHEADDENGEPTCWVADIGEKNRQKRVWITKQPDGTFAIEIKKDDQFEQLVLCDSVKSAKRWAVMMYGNCAR